MLSGFVQMLLWAHNSVASSRAVPTMDKCELADYATFGAQKVMTLSALEGQTLDTLREFCMGRDNPEVPETLSNASARWVTPRDKARCVVLSVLSKEDPLVLLSQLMACTGFASHYLLAKIFREDFVKSLRSKAHTCNELDVQFDKAIEEHMVKLGPVEEYINECVLTTTRMDFGDYVAQNGDRDTGFDFGVLGARMLECESGSASAAISKQIELWLAGESVNEKLLATACEFTRVVLHSDVLEPAGVTDYQSFIALLAARSPHKELLALFNAFHDSSAAQSRVTEILSYDGHFRVRPDFFLNYLKWLKKFGNSPATAISFSWRRYLRDRYALSHVLQTCADPRFFVKEVPYLLLHESFTHLHAEKADISRRDEAAHVIMESLSCFTFTRVLVQDKMGKHHALMRFMLGNLSDDAKATYLTDIKYIRVNKHGNRAKKYMDIYRDIEAELKSHKNSTLSAASVPRAV
ncbi:hypothetical protein PAPHI01_2242 [Pancytospora philotis]|nr:hypothetical protein PAPHI01_2242 [Pancytospora philotis]